jgi:microcystin-dependent protein
MPNLSDSIALSTGNLPTGTIVNFGFDVIPAGYLEIDGSAVSRVTFKALFNVIGTTYGIGDGSTTFNLPDGRGIFLRGVGSQVVAAVTYDGGALGNKTKDRTHSGGLSASTTSTNSASLVADNANAHSHSWTDRYLSAPSLTSSFSGQGTIPLAISYVNNEVLRTTQGPTPALNNHNHTILTNTVSSVSTLSGGQGETVPGYLTAKIGIKV